MNASRFFDIISRKTNVSKAEIKLIVSQMKNTLLDILNKGSELKILNFGRFFVQERKERKIKSFITKRKILVERKSQIKFVLSKNFKYCIK